MPISLLLQAEQLRLHTLLLPKAARERLSDPDEFWVQDLVGCQVFYKVCAPTVWASLQV